MTKKGRGNWTVKHGGSRRGLRLPEYNIWAKMRSRCENTNNKDFRNYGGRGITVCERWRSFANFIVDMGRRPSSQHTIERIDNDSCYSIDNCIWATRDIQARNRRPRRLLSVCQRGHELSGENVYLRANGKRGCKKCRRLNMQSFLARRNRMENHAST